MAPRTTPAPAADGDAATVTVARGERIRCRHGDVFVVDDKTTVTGDWTEFPPSVAKVIVEAAKRNGVQIVVEKKGGA